MCQELYMEKIRWEVLQDWWMAKKSICVVLLELSMQIVMELADYFIGQVSTDMMEVIVIYLLERVCEIVFPVVM